MHSSCRPKPPWVEGGEAWVFALDDDRVLRVLHEGGSIDDLLDRQHLVDELARADTSFLVPSVVETGSVGARAYAVERRLAGRSGMEVLAELDRPDRDALIVDYLEVIGSLGDLALDPRPWFGDILGEVPIRRATWPEYLVAKAADGLARAPGFEGVDPGELAAALPQDADVSFVHMDAFLGNVLAVGPKITAVIDFGNTSLRGDRRLELLSAVVYLCAEPISPAVDAGDRDVALRHLADAGLADFYEPARRWIAAYWAWAVEDDVLHQWCRGVLLD